MFVPTRFLTHTSKSNGHFFTSISLDPSRNTARGRWCELKFSVSRSSTRTYFMSVSSWRGLWGSIGELPVSSSYLEERIRDRNERYQSEGLEYFRGD
jgi:hypothetical protein